MTKNIIIVGGGPGGCMTANHLAKTLKNNIQQGSLQITLLSDVEQHIYQPGYLFIALNLNTIEHFTRGQRELLVPEINFIVDPATMIDVDSNRVRSKSGKEYPYDFLLIATGSQIRPDITPGLDEGGDSFYTLEGTNQLKEKITNFQSGKILCTVELPHKCPVAFLEILFMLNDYYKMKGIRDKIQLTFSYPAQSVHMHPPIANFAQPLLDADNILYNLGYTVERVDPQARKVYSKDGRELDYDILITIPTHRAAQVIFDSGLGDDEGWIDTDPHTLKMIGKNNVYVIGDATNLHKINVSKAGSVAHYEAEIVAQNIIQELQGIGPNTFYDGKAFCFIETGLNQASSAQMDYLTPPKPAPPSVLLHWFKLSFNEMYWAAVRGLI